MSYDLTEIKLFIEKLFEDHDKQKLLYHNLEHTLTVVSRADEISASYNLNKVDRFTLLAAAWFHDCGHLIGDAAIHENNSVIIMREYFKSKDIPYEIINVISQCIMATKLPVNPKNLL